jgi:hypothetical protein
LDIRGGLCVRTVYVYRPRKSANYALKVRFVYSADVRKRRSAQKSREFEWCPRSRQTHTEVVELKGFRAMGQIFPPRFPPA